MKKKYIKDYVPKEGTSSYEYVGKYYICELTEEEQVKTARIQIGYALTALLLLIFALCLPALGTQTLYVVLPLEFIMICHVYYLTGSFGLFRMKGKMEQKTYDHLFERPIQTLTVSLFLEMIALAGEGFVVLRKQPAGKTDLTLIFLLAVHLPISIMIWNRQRKVMHRVKEVKEED